MRFSYSTTSPTQDEFDSLPLLLGQTNFFMEFDVHFYRSRLEFEVEPKS